MENLDDGLKDLGFAKNKRPELHNIAKEETELIKIYEKLEVKKKQYDNEKELGVCQPSMKKKDKDFENK